MSLFASQLKASLVPLGGIKHYQWLDKGHLAPESLETSSQDTRVLKLRDLAVLWTCGLGLDRE